MNLNENAAAKIAEYLLQINAIKLSPENPFTWTSGWRSPIYSDNRLSLSHVHVRDFIKKELSLLVKNHFPTAEAIIGVATAGIAPGTLVADELQLPFGYVRSEAKKHGMGKQVEGDINSKMKVVVIEDLISTGKSSLQAIQSLRDFGCEVLGMASIFTYDFDAARKSFEDANCSYFSLSNYPILIEIALQQGFVKPEHIELLAAWRKNPETWCQ